jgi:hypothetical protein
MSGQNLERATRRRIMVASLAVGATMLAGCTGNTAESPDAQAATDAKPKAVALPPEVTRWPLTGLSAGSTTVRHPVMVVKIDNTESSSPQVGLGGADLITEELVEGGLTRLAAFYYENAPELVGPVRSMRATDVGVVKPVDAVLVAAGGAPPTIRRIRSAEIRTFGEGAPGFQRMDSRSAPYNLFVDLAELAGTVKAAGVPEDYLPWGSDDDLPAGRPAKGLSASFSGAHSTTWEFRDGKYVNLNSFADEGDEFRPDTVLVLRVRVGDAGYRDVAGNPVPETLFTGQGDAMIFRGGRVVRATWEKDLDTTISLRTEDGALQLPPGRVWIELLPTKGGSVSVTP